MQTLANNELEKGKTNLSYRIEIFGKKLQSRNIFISKLRKNKYDVRDSIDWVRNIWDLDKELETLIEYHIAAGYHSTYPFSKWIPYKNWLSFKSYTNLTEPISDGKIIQILIGQLTHEENYLPDNNDSINSSNDDLYNTQIINTDEETKFSDEDEQIFDLFNEKYSFIGQSKAMLKIFTLIIRFADNINILITGETGSGKEKVARAIWELSNRKDKRFNVVNCALITDELKISELFGHEKGAFTDAYKKKLGLFETTNGGTLFWDEIGDMDYGVQASILRALEENTMTRLGGEKEIHYDIRFIFATNMNLKEEIGKKRFRFDLYERINTINIQIPPLRNRIEDIPILSLYFFNEYMEKYGNQLETEEKIINFKVTADLFDVLCQRDWEGNVRGLENHIQRVVAAIYSSSNKINRTLFEELVNDPVNTKMESNIDNNTTKDRFSLTIKDWDRLTEFILLDLIVAKASKKLSLDPKTYRKKLHTILMKLSAQFDFNEKTVAKFLVEEKEILSNENIDKFENFLLKRFQLILKDNKARGKPNTYYSEIQVLVDQLSSKTIKNII